MTTSSPLPTTRTTDSSTQNPTLGAVRGSSAHQAKPPVGRADGFARRFVSALMRSLAAPHV